MSHFRPILIHFGLTEQQWRILRALDERVELEPRELCELCQISSPSMAGVLARMEATGFIGRGPVSGDQRRVMVRLAPKGHALIDDIAPLIDQQYRHIEHAYGVQTTDAVFNALEKFILSGENNVEQVVLPGKPL